MFFTPLYPRGTEIEEEFHADLTKPRNVLCKTEWKHAQDAVYCIHFGRAQEKGTAFWQTNSHAIIAYCTTRLYRTSDPTTWMTMYQRSSTQKKNCKSSGSNSSSSSKVSVAGVTRSPAPSEPRAAVPDPTASDAPRDVRGVVPQAPLSHGNAGVISTAAGCGVTPNDRCGARCSDKHPRAVQCGLAALTRSVVCVADPTFNRSENEPASGSVSCSGCPPVSHSRKACQTRLRSRGALQDTASESQTREVANIACDGAAEAKKKSA